MFYMRGYPHIPNVVKRKNLGCEERMNFWNNKGMVRKIKKKTKYSKLYVNLK